LKGLPIDLFDSPSDVFALPKGEIPEVPAVERNEEEQEDNAFILATSKPLGQVSGLGIDSKGRLIAFHRADREWNDGTFTDDFKLNGALGVIPNSTIAVIDPINGQVVSEFGENLFYLPHGLTVDQADNIWVTDVGSHQVHKLDKNFKPVMSLGEKLVPGNDGKHFCKPTDVAVATNGHFFVADGYCNSRVLKFDSKGNLIDVIASEQDPFIVPHSLALIEDLNLLCVADRENERVQCFSAGLKEGHRSIPAGIPITSAYNIGRVFAIRERKHFLVGVTGVDGEESLEPQLFVMDMDNGKAQTFLK
jgi:peptidylamidoglycolate lyase